MIAILLAVGGACLAGAERRQLRPFLRLSAFAGLIAAAGLAFAVELSLERELVELYISLWAVASALGLVAWGVFVSMARQGLRNGQVDRIASLILPIGVFWLVLANAVEITYPAAAALIGEGEFTATDWAMHGVALAIAVVLGVFLRNALAEINRRWVFLGIILLALIELVREATAAIQLMMVRGVLPLYNWLFEIIVPLINHDTAFYYGFLGIALLLVFLAALNRWRQRGVVLVGDNPARTRKLKSAARSRSMLVAMAVASLGIVLILEGANSVSLEKSFRLSPAVAVAAQEDAIRLAVSDVNDGEMYRFAYETDGVPVRFLVINKGSGVFGVGLDACSFCGVAGYQQRGRYVICNKCGAAINVSTIGSAGGCNPIPIDHRIQDGIIVIPVQALAQGKDLFK